MTAICECAHISHCDFSARTPDGLLGHRLFDHIPKEHMTKVKVDGRTATVCKNCAGDCLRKELTNGKTDNKTKDN